MARDVTLAVVLMLKLDAGVNALVGDRVFGAELPGGEVQHMPRKAVVVRRVAGVGGLPGRLELESGVIETVCYGETPLEASVVRAAVHSAMKYAARAVHTGTLLHSFDQISSAVDLRDADTQWPVAVVAWQFLASEVEAN